MSDFYKPHIYEQAIAEINGVLQGETHATLKMATINSVLRQHLPYYFWVGFYCLHQGELLVSAYQGTLGCLHIPLHKGVCGRAARLQQTQIVTDVHADIEHIACDSRSQSEIVVPVFNADKQLIAVFDVDSTEVASFDDIDQLYLEQILRKHFQENPTTHWNYEF